MDQCFGWIDNKEIGEHVWSTEIAYILLRDGHVICAQSLLGTVAR